MLVPERAAHLVEVLIVIHFDYAKRVAKKARACGAEGENAINHLLILLQFLLAPSMVANTIGLN